MSHQIKLSVVGLTAAGKTAFAAALTKGHPEGQSFKAADQDTQDYLERIVDTVENGGEVEGTQGDPRSLRIVRESKQGTVEICFKDCMGEKIADGTDFAINNVIDDAEGVVLLLNPRTELQELAKRKTRKKQYATLISQCKNRVKYFTLVTTASDCLERMTDDERAIYRSICGDVWTDLSSGCGFHATDRSEVFSFRKFDRPGQNICAFSGNTAYQPINWLVGQIEQARRAEAEKEAAEKSRKEKESQARAKRRTRIAVSCILGLACATCTILFLKKGGAGSKPLPPTFGPASTGTVNVQPGKASPPGGRDLRLAPEREARLRATVDRFIGEELPKAKDALNAVYKFAGLYEENAQAPNIREAARAVDKVVEAEYARLTAALKDAASGENPTNCFYNLKELSAAVLQPAARALLGDSPWRTFADVYYSEARQGIRAAFAGSYEVSRVEAKIDYSKFPVNFQGVEFSVSGQETGEDDKETLSEWGPCRTALEADNGQWITVWEGRRDLKGSPWRTAAVCLTATDLNGNFIKKKSSLAIPLEGGASILEAGMEYIERETVLEVDRWTGDKKPKLSYRIYVKGQGKSLSALVPQMQQDAAR